MVRKIMKYLYCLVGGGATRWGSGVGVFYVRGRGVLGGLTGVLESGRRGGYEYGLGF